MIKDRAFTYMLSSKKSSQAIHLDIETRIMTSIFIPETFKHAPVSILSKKKVTKLMF